MSGLQPSALPVSLLLALLDCVTSTETWRPLNLSEKQNGGKDFLKKKPLGF